MAKVYEIRMEVKTNSDSLPDIERAVVNSLLRSETITEVVSIKVEQPFNVTELSSTTTEAELEKQLRDSAKQRPTAWWCPYCGVRHSPESGCPGLSDEVPF